MKSYPPGVRENGGQYTHAATWFVIAQAELGLADDAWRSFRMLNPINHALDAAAAELYRVEPYVVAADIYSVGPLAGRGGWTWYTGSAGWLYRAAVEAILGIRKQGNGFVVKPQIPGEWNGFSATIRLGGTSCHIEVERDAERGKPAMEIDGRPTERGAFQLPEGAGEIKIIVRIGGNGGQPAPAIRARRPRPADSAAANRVEPDASRRRRPSARTRIAGRLAARCRNCRRSRAARCRSDAVRHSFAASRRLFTLYVSRLADHGTLTGILNSCSRFWNPTLAKRIVLRRVER